MEVDKDDDDGDGHDYDDNNDDTNLKTWGRHVCTTALLFVNIFWASLLSPLKNRKVIFFTESVPFSEISTFEKWTSSELEKRSMQSPEKSPYLDLPTHP